MKNDSDHFSINIVEPRIVALPNLLEDSLFDTYVSALMSVTSGSSIVCEWEEDDVDAALRDFAEKYTFHVGDEDLHVDLFLYAPNIVYVNVWRGPDESTVAVAETTETEYYGAVDRAIDALRAWRETR